MDNSSGVLVLVHDVQVHPWIYRLCDALRESGSTVSVYAHDNRAGFQEKIDSVRNAYTALAAQTGRVGVIGLGMANVFSLMLAEQYNVEMLICIDPELPVSNGFSMLTHLTVNNLFAIVVPVLLIGLDARKTVDTCIRKICEGSSSSMCTVKQCLEISGKTAQIDEIINVVITYRNGITNVKLLAK